MIVLIIKISNNKLNIIINISSKLNINNQTFILLPPFPIIPCDFIQGLCVLVFRAL